MAHFAELGAGTLVVRVVVVANCECEDADGIEQERLGVSFCERHLGGRWIQTSYNGRIRGRYAGVGFSYDEERDVFIPPKPYPSWVFDETSCDWVSPLPQPPSGLHSWDEDGGGWVPSPMTTM
jgi:hypothetical protein